MRTTSFVNFSQKYASAMAGRNIPVAFGGKDAWTDNRQIQLPALPAGTLMTPWETKVLTGYLDHEVGHLRYTDWNENRIHRPVTAQAEFQKKLLTHYLYNVFEDVRMENRTIEDSPPIKNYLDAVEQQLQYEQRKRVDPPTAGGAILAAIYHEAYHEYRKPNITWEPGHTLDQFPQLKPVREAMRALKGMRSTAAACDLAEKVYDLLPKGLDYGVKAPPKPQPGETFTFFLPNGHGGGQEVDIPAEVIEAAMELTDKPEALQTLLESIELENNPANSTPIEEQRWGIKILPPADTSKDKIFVPTRRDRAQAEQTRAAAADQIRAAKRMLNIALRARTKKAWERGLPEGTLDDEALPNLYAGSTDLFKQRRSTQLVDTAVQVMIDLSGSMRVQETRLAGIIVCEALAGIRGIKMSIGGFTAPGYAISAPQEGVGRNVALEIPLFKDFDEPYQIAFERLGALRCNGATPLSDAFALGLERLVPRKEPRKVLWIITDGDPAIATCDQAHNEFFAMERVYRRCKEMQIKILLLHIGNRINPKTVACADWAGVVSSPTLLPGALLELTRRIAQ